MASQPPHAPAPAPHPVQILDESSRGAIVRTVYAEREVEVWAVFDTEVDNVSSLNAYSTIFFSVGSGLFSLAGGICLSAIFTEKLSPAGTVALTLGAPVLAILGGVFVILAVMAWWKRRRAIDVIRRRSNVKASE